VGVIVVERRILKNEIKKGSRLISSLMKTMRGTIEEGKGKKARRSNFGHEEADGIGESQMGSVRVRWDR
jgi:hypothetical protein